ncbi:hypothetical protein [Coleofasciculus sp. FACHB-1120]|uniref:hypothetical protein n=1 Tax=Coleofasciculus sp. FACHB-1120 TaxID=2692783 RepID=UPI0016860CC3|nr:hypothetical protein [Coleofasciculus sp. FACHB-1120]MBD2740102.1 hypothetical protein [Coleofasciculus sp. FACHB-1120]
MRSQEVKIAIAFSKARAIALAKRGVSLAPTCRFPYSPEQYDSEVPTYRFAILEQTLRRSHSQLYKSAIAKEFTKDIYG